MRYYDHEFGRFLSRDPEMYADSMNLYQAFKLNPINFIDPMGTVTGSFRVFQHPVTDVRDIPDNPHYIQGVTKLRTEESRIDADCEFFSGKWHPKFVFYLTFDIWYLNTPGSNALKHELDHISDMKEAYDTIWEILFEIETAYDKFSFKDKNSCKKASEKIQKFVISYIRKASEKSEFFRDIIPIPFLKKVLS